MKKSKELGRMRFELRALKLENINVRKAADDQRARNDMLYAVFNSKFEEILKSQKNILKWVDANGDNILRVMRNCEGLSATVDSLFSRYVGQAAANRKAKLKTVRAKRGKK